MPKRHLATSVTVSSILSVLVPQSQIQAPPSLWACGCFFHVSGGSYEPCAQVVSWGCTRAQAIWAHWLSTAAIHEVSCSTCNPPSDGIPIPERKLAAGSKGGKSCQSLVRGLNSQLLLSGNQGSRRQGHPSEQQCLFVGLGLHISQLRKATWRILHLEELGR